MKKMQVWVLQLKQNWAQIALVVWGAIAGAIALDHHAVYAATTTTENRAGMGMVQLGAILLLMILLIGISHRFTHRNG